MRWALEPLVGTKSREKALVEQRAGHRSNHQTTLRCEVTQQPQQGRLEQLADEQNDDEIEADLIREACDDAAVALQDRDVFEGPWNNIFVTVASEDDGFVYIFDEDGQPLDRGDVKPWQTGARR